MFRHGDLLLKPVKTTGRFKPQQDYILALGEHTGHKHQLRGGVGLLERNSTRYLKFDIPTELTHEEHNTLTITPGTYEIVQEREFDYFLNEITRVQD